MKPEDTRCQVAVGGGRCTREITFDTESGNWLKWCAEHQAQEEEARIEGGPRLAKFESDSDPDESDSDEDE